MSKAKKTIRARRTFTPEFKADAVRLVLAGTSASQVAKEHDLTETALREWVKRAEEGSTAPAVGVLATEEREELGRLRREIKQLRLEREILKAAALHSTGRRNTGALRPEAAWGSKDAGCCCRRPRGPISGGGGESGNR